MNQRVSTSIGIGLLVATPRASGRNSESKPHQIHQIHQIHKTLLHCSRRGPPAPSALGSLPSIIRRVRSPDGTRHTAPHRCCWAPLKRDMGDHTRRTCVERCCMFARIHGHRHHTPVVTTRHRRRRSPIDSLPHISRPPAVPRRAPLLHHEFASGCSPATFVPLPPPAHPPPLSHRDLLCRKNCGEMGCCSRSAARN